MALTTRDLGNENRVKAYEYIQRMDVTSRVDISRGTGLSAPTAKRIVDQFVERGLVIETEPQPGALGRRPIGLMLNRDFARTAAVMWEGRGVRVDIMDMRGEVVVSHQTSFDGDLSDLIRVQIPALIDLTLPAEDPSAGRLIGIGLGLPAILDPYERVVWDAPLIHVTARTDMTPWLMELEGRYQAFTVIENDVNLQALGEHAARDIGTGADMAYVSLGTGVGSGLMLRGELRRGRNNMAGEIGYLLVREGDTWRTLEEIVGREGLRERLGFLIEGRLSDVHRARAAAFVARVLTPVLVNYAAAFDLDLIVLGGQTADTLGETLIEEIQRLAAAMAHLPFHVALGVSKRPGLEGLRYLLDRRFRQNLLKWGMDALPAAPNITK